ncbi:MAG TPA: Calx-beta domain-containing protein [Phycisphaerae bacterium]|nr:Calx-beta domain-containing protein [Phycisphaerae bacterium]
MEAVEPRVLFSTATLAGAQTSYTGIETTGPYASSGYMPVSGSRQQSFYQVFALLDYQPGNSVYPAAGTQVNDISDMSLTLYNTAGEGTSGYAAHPGSFSVYLLPDNNAATSSLTFQASDVHGLNGQAGSSSATLLGSIPFTSGSIPVGSFTTQLTNFASDSAKQLLINALNGHSEFRVAITPDSTTVAADFEGHFGGRDPMLSLTVDQSAVSTVEQFAFSTSAYSVSETAGTATVTVNRSGSTADSASIQYATSDATALAGTNYTATNGTLNFAVGQTSATFTVPVTDVLNQGGNKVLNLALSNVTSTGSNVTLIIAQPAASLTVTDLYATAGNTLNLTQSSSNNSTVQVGGPRAGTSGITYFNVAGSDAGNSASFGALDFNDSSTAFTFSNATPIAAVNSITLGLTQGYPPSSFNTTGPMAAYLVEDTTTDITADGSSPLIFDRTDSTGEGVGSQLGVKHLLGTFAYDSNLPTDVFTQFTLTGYDQATANEIVHDLNTGTKFRVVVVPENSSVEGSFEGQYTFGGTYEAPELTFNVTKAAQVSLSAPTYTVNAADGIATVTVNRTGSLVGPVSIAFSTADGTAIAGTDYTATAGTLNFADGQATATFTIPVANLGVAGSKDFSLSLSNPSPYAVLGSQTSAVVTINSTASTLYGDVNNDGNVDLGDLAAFRTALTLDQATFAAQHPTWNYAAADLNHDGNVDFGDLAAFRSALAGT